MYTCVSTPCAVCELDLKQKMFFFLPPSFVYNNIGSFPTSAAISSEVALSEKKEDSISSSTSFSSARQRAISEAEDGDEDDDLLSSGRPSRKRSSRFSSPAAISVRSSPPSSSVRRKNRPGSSVTVSSSSELESLNSSYSRTQSKFPVTRPKRRYDNVSLDPTLVEEVHKNIVSSAKEDARLHELEEKERQNSLTSEEEKELRQQQKLVKNREVCLCVSSNLFFFYL